MELTREVIEFIRKAAYEDGGCSSAKLQEQGQAILRDIAKSLSAQPRVERELVLSAVV